MIKLSVDGMEIKTPAGSTILAAADAAGLYIPRLCSHPDLPAVDPAALEPWAEIHQGAAKRKHEPSADGDSDRYEGCRLCLVEIEGREEPIRACTLQVDAGMRVVTASPALDSLRRARLREIFATHPHACVQCAQKAGCVQEPCSTNVDKQERCCPIFADCELRRVAEHVGIPADTPRYLPAGLPLIEDEPLILREHELCIGCLRCVRVCRDVWKIDALGFVRDGGGRIMVGTKAPTLKESGCNFCLSCVEVCPTGTLRPRREETRREGNRVPPCVATCPAGMDVPRYIREIRRGEFGRAEAVVREAAPLPRVLGQVCFHPCEEHCLRSDVSEPVAICALKRAALEHAGDPIWKSFLAPRPESGKRVGVVGAGPAGLSAAWYLRLMGHEVTLFDSQAQAGGWLRNGIPAYRISAEALDADIVDLLGLGIEVRTSVEIGRDLDFAELRAGHDAVCIAAGARRAKRLPCEGAELSGVESGLELLAELAGGETRSLTGETVVVIGGGNVAIDVARTARRLGPERVLLYCLETREQMPAHEWEIAEAEGEGVEVHAGWGPARMAGEDRVQRVDFRRCISVFDSTGRFAPEFDESETASQAADRVLVAIGQEPSLDFLGNDNFERSGAGTVKTDGGSLRTSLAGVFAGGEVVSGPASVIDAVAQGRRAAAEIDRHLGGDGEIRFPLLDETEPDRELSGAEGFAALERTPMSRLPAEEATTCLSLVEAGYSAEEAMREAAHCLRCDLRLRLGQNPPPPEPWLEFGAEAVASLPETEGVYQLLDEEKAVYAIKGVDDLKAALTELLETSVKARFFLIDEDPMYSKRESELIQAYLQQHGCMPPGEGDDDLDDLF